MGKKSNPFYQAQAILARRDHSQAEVEQKLARKGFTRAQIAKVVETLQEQKIIDDRKFARAYVENILLTKPVGPRYLRAKLQQKRVGESIIEAAIQEIFSSFSEVELIQETIRRWKRSYPKHAEGSERLFRHLVSRGFTMDRITSAVNAESVPPSADASQTGV